MGDDEEGVLVERIASMPAPLRMDEKDGGLHLHFRLRSEVHDTVSTKVNNAAMPEGEAERTENAWAMKSRKNDWDAACYRSLQIHTNIAFLDAV